MTLLHSLSASLVAALILAGTAQAATITINNNDGSGEGFNDPTPVSPVGGNGGRTLGEQRLIAYQFAADRWGAALQSTITIEIDANFDPLPCSSSGGTLGFAGPNTVHSNFTNAPLSDVFYPQALANALAGADQSAADADLISAFNSSLDDDCIGNGITWYYGLDGNPPGNQLDFLGTAVHEIAHGLGFASFTDPVTGVYPGGTSLGGGGNPGIYEVFIKDLAQNQTWAQMGSTSNGNNMRAASAVNTGNLVWNGPSATAQGAPAIVMGTANDPNDGNTPKIMLYAPAPVEPGSSISHWDTSVVPEAMMEPFENGYNVIQRGFGLASCLMQDIGWILNAGFNCPDGAVTTPLFDQSPTSWDFGASTPNVTKRQAFTVRNVGIGNLAVSNVKISGGDFSIAGDTCTGNSLAAGAAGCSFDLLFTPANTKRQKKTLTVTTNAPGSPHSAPISGGGSGPGSGGGGGGLGSGEDGYGGGSGNKPSNGGDGGAGSSATGLFLPLFALIAGMIRRQLPPARKPTKF